MPLLGAIGLPSIFRRQLPIAMRATCPRMRSIVTSEKLKSPSEHKVILDNETLYIEQSLAEALGWKPEKGSDAGIQLSLSGWGPTYFAIAPTGSDSDRLARGVVESSHNQNVKFTLDYLKDR